MGQTIILEESTGSKIPVTMRLHNEDKPKSRISPTTKTRRRWSGAVEFFRRVRDLYLFCSGRDNLCLARTAWKVKMPRGIVKRIVRPKKKKKSLNTDLVLVASTHR